MNECLRIRNELGLTQKEMAQGLKVSTRTIRRWENLGIIPHRILVKMAIFASEGAYE